jgi:predicted PurR-regulated permease PerM
MSFPSPSYKQARVVWFSLTALAAAVLVALGGLLIWGLSWLLGRLSAVLLPAAFALILAYILDPVVEFFVRKKVSRPRAIVLVFLLGLAIFAGVLGSVIPGMVNETRKLVYDFPETSKTLHKKVENFLESPLGGRLQGLWHPGSTAKKALPAETANGQITVTNGVGTNLEFKSADRDKAGVLATNQTEAVVNPDTAKPLDASLDETVMAGLTKVGAWILNGIAAQLGKVTTWVEFLFGFVLVPVYLFYFLLEKKGINRSWTDYLPLQESRAKDEIVFVLKSINDCMIAFFRGQVLVALCVGTLLAVGYLVLGLNYAVLLGGVAAVLGIVPYLGTIISLGLALIVAGVQFGDWTHPLLVLAIAATVKLLEDFVISPKIIGNRSGLHPLTIIVAVTVGTTLLGGFLGAVLAIPLTAALRTLMFRYIWKRPEAKASAVRPKEEMAGVV